MEEDKAAAYYEELTRKGEGAARFKQGLGFSSSNTCQTNPSRGSALPSSSSFLSSFVRASSPGKASETEKQAQLENIQNKLKKKQQSSESETRSRVSESRSIRERDIRSSRRRSRSRSRSRDDDGYNSRRRRRSSSGERERLRDRGRDRGKSERSRSRSHLDREEGRRRRRSRDGEVKGRRSRSRSTSPRERRSEKRGGGDRRSEGKGHKEKNGAVDYSSLIKGYSEMTPAERVKSKMKLQLSQTVEKDTLKGMGAGWERFEFNKDAPLDDEELEVAEDDAKLVKNIGQSFRFSAVEARREEQIKAIHDEAMFGPAAPTSIVVDREPTLEDDGKEENDRKENTDSSLSTNLISDKVLAKQHGSWRDRARKLQGR